MNDIEHPAHSHKYDDLLPRLNRIEGQIRGIKRMVENDKPCEELLVQFLAAEGAIRNLGKIVLKEHLTSCVKEGIERGESGAMESFYNVLNKFI